MRGQWIAVLARKLKEVTLSSLGRSDIGWLVNLDSGVREIGDDRDPGSEGLSSKGT